MMIETKEVKCPYCGKIQTDDIYDFVDCGDNEGIFNQECDECEQEFSIEFEFVPFIKTEYV